MSKNCDKVLLVAKLSLLVIAIAYGITLAIQESPEQAYERGKIDGQLLVFEKYDKDSLLFDIWGQRIIGGQPESTNTMPALDSLEQCFISLLIHSWDGSLSYCVLCGSKYVLLDSTDTMPAVKEQTDLEEMLSGRPLLRWGLSLSETQIDSLLGDKRSIQIRGDTMPAVDLGLHPKAVMVPHLYPDYPTPRRGYYATGTPLPAVEEE